MYKRKAPEGFENAYDLVDSTVAAVNNASLPIGNICKCLRVNYKKFQSTQFKV